LRPGAGARAGPGGGRPDHADQALAVALEIDEAVRDEFAGELKIGIGLNSGTVVAGNVGGAGPFEFSVIGDAVNVAARVESATRKTGDTILLAEDVKRLLCPTSSSSSRDPMWRSRENAKRPRSTAPAAPSHQRPSTPATELAERG
jgi:adenylate cyclase